MRILAILILAGCSSSASSPPPQSPEVAAEPTPVEAEPAPVETAEPTAAPEPSTDPSGSVDKKAIAAKIVAMFGELAGALTANEDDCAAMASAIDSVAAGNLELIAQAKAIDDDLEFKRWFEQTHGEQVKAIMTGAMTSMMKNCANDEGVKQAFGRMFGD
jgi:hypothetical protein